MSGHELKNAERIFNDLRQNPGDITVTAEEAAEIWKVFRKHPIDQGRLEREDYRAFLQAALMAAVDGSEAVSWIEALFRSAYKPGAKVSKILKKLATTALKKYYRKFSGGSPDLYQMVISAIAYQCKFYFDAINQDLDL